MDLFKTASLTTAAFFAAAALAPGAQAQMTDSSASFDLSDFSVSLEAGASAPAGELNHATDIGGAFGADLALSLTDRFALTIDGDVDVLPGEDQIDPTPDMRLWHVGAGAEYTLTDQRLPWSVELEAGVGATTMDTDDFLATTQVVGDDPDADFTQTYLNLNSGVEVAYDVTEHVGVALHGAGFVVFTDEDETETLASESLVLEPFDTAVTFPLTAQLQISLPN